MKTEYAERENAWVKGYCFSSIELFPETKESIERERGCPVCMVARNRQAGSSETARMNEWR